MKCNIPHFASSLYFEFALGFSIPKIPTKTQTFRFLLFKDNLLGKRVSTEPHEDDELHGELKQEEGKNLYEVKYGWVK